MNNVQNTRLQCVTSVLPRWLRSNTRCTIIPRWDGQSKYLHPRWTSSSPIPPSPLSPLTNSSPDLPSGESPSQIFLATENPLAFLPAQKPMSHTFASSVCLTLDSKVALVELQAQRISKCRWPSSIICIHSNRRHIRRCLTSYSMQTNVFSSPRRV